MALDFNRFRGSANSFGTQYVDGLFKPSITYRANAKYNQDITNSIVESMNTRPKSYVDPNKERSFIDRGFDALLLPNYVVAGAFDGLVRQDRGVLEGMWEGAKAGNPFGKGFEEGETTFSDVLRSGMDRAGIEHPDSLLGKVAVGTAGFVLDVLLDPTTYMTFGLSAGIKGTGKVGKAAQAIEKLAADNPQFAEGLLEAGEMTDELAQAIVMRSNGIESMDEIAESASAFATRSDEMQAFKMSKDQFMQEVTELKHTYNKLQGIGRTGRGISIGVQNMPFGDFVARKLNITTAPKTLIQDASIRKFSDSVGMSTAYQASRNAFLGSRIGQALSRNSGLKKLADTDPAKLYEYVGALNKLRGKDLDKLAREQYIKDYSEQLLGLSPAEQKKIIKALENPALWKPVKEMIQDEASVLAKLETEYADANEALKSSIAEAKTILDEYKNGSVDELKGFKKEVEKLQKLESIEPKQANVLKQLNDEINELIKQKETIATRTNVGAKDYSKIIDELEYDVNDMIKYKEDLVRTAEAGNTYRTMPQEEISSMLTNHTARIDELDAMKAVDGKEGTNIALNKQAEVSALRKLVSEILYGNADVIPPSVSAGRIRSIADAIKAGSDDMQGFESALRGETGGYNFYSNFKNAREVQDYLDSSSDIYEAMKNVLRSGSLMNDEMREVYSYVANKLGYKSVNDIRKKTDDIAKKLNLESGKLTRPLKDDAEHALFDEYNKLVDTLFNRSKMLQDIAKVGEPAEQAKYVKRLQQEELADEMHEILYGDADMARKYKDGIADLSDTREGMEYAGTKLNARLNIEDMRFAEEASTWGTGAVSKSVADLEVEHMRATQNKVPFTSKEIRANSKESIKQQLLKNRRSSLLNYRLSPDAKQALKDLNAKASKLNDIKAKFRNFKNKEDFKKAYDEAMDEYKVAREFAEKNTNLFKVSKELDKLSPTDVKTLGAQLEASLYIQSHRFNRNKFEDLTTSQKNLITGKAYGWTKDYIAKNGIPTKKDLEKFYKHLYKEMNNFFGQKVSKVAHSRLTQKHMDNVASKVNYYTGIEFKVGNEVQRGVVIGIKEDTRIVERKSVDVRLVGDSPDPDVFAWVDVPVVDKKTGKIVINKKTGKPVTRKEPKPYARSKPRLEQVETITKHEEGLGSYTYQVETADGVIAVKQADVVGTYENAIDEIATKIPKHVEEEIARVDDYIKTLKNRIRANKGAQTRQANKVAKSNEELAEQMKAIDNQLEELKTRKMAEEEILIRSRELIDEQKDYMKRLFDAENVEDITKRNETLINDLQYTLNQMIARQETLEKALADNELFEQLVKLDLGNEEYTKLLEASAREMDGDKLVIDLVQDWDENIKMHAKAIRKAFYDAGLDEVEVGKLDAGAFEYMANKYFPRTLSEDGIKYFDENPNLAEKYLSPTRGYGFGKAFNEHVLRRNEELRDKSLQEVNDYFQNKIGVRIFEENLGKAYLNRMMTSNEMVYDQRAMFDLMYRFGHSAREGIMPGYKAVANYGQLRNVIRTQVTERIKKELSEKAKERGQLVNLSKEEYDAMAIKYAEEMLEDAGMDVRILDGNTTPLIEVPIESLDNALNVFGDAIRQVNTVTVDRANQVRELIMQRDAHKMLQLYDKFMTFFKLNQTTVMPAFHVRNHMGAMFVGWLGVGREALSFRAQKTAYDALKLYGNDKALRELRPIVTDDRTKVYRYDEVMRLAQMHHVVDEGFMMKDFASHSYSKGTGMIPGKYDPFNTKEFGLYKIGSKVATYSDNINRITQFTALLKQGKTPAEASDIVRHYMFDYSDLTSFEMNWMKRIFPYYTYMRKNIPMMANEFLDNPEKLQLIAKLTNLPEGMVNDEDKIAEHEKLGFAQDWIQMPFTGLSGQGKEGDREPILFNPNLPYMQLRDLNMEGNIGEQARTLFSQSAPMIKVPVELATNWNSFFDDEIVGEDGDQISPRLTHVLSQLAMFNAGKQFVEAKTSDDKILSMLNTATGQKMTTYDIEGAREKVMEETYNREYELTVKNLLGSGVGIAKGLIDNTRADMSNFAVKLAGKPYDATDEVGVYAPISDRTYEEMSDEQRQLYTFDEETKAYVHQRALEFEREQYEKTGIFKKFLWTLVEADTPEKAIVRVERVTDGDTFVASQGDEQFDVRLLLVDTPESKGEYKDRPQQFSQDATQYTTDMVLGKDVTLHLDSKTTYGRKLAFVEVAGQSLQEGLLREGLGKVRQYDTNYTEIGNELYNIEEDAYRNQRGVWSESGNAVPRSNTGFVR